jgi:hypothetical protein
MRANENALGVKRLIGLFMLPGMALFAAWQFSPNPGVVGIGVVTLTGFVGLGILFLRAAESRSPHATTRPTALEPTSDLHLTRGDPPSMGTAAALIRQLRAADQSQLEKLVTLVYCKLGYHVASRNTVNQGSAIDFVVEKDGYQTGICCRPRKMYNVSAKSMGEFSAALTGAGIQGGMFITLTGCSDEDKAFAEAHHIRILDEVELASVIESLCSKHPHFSSTLRGALGRNPSPARVAIDSDPPAYEPVGQFACQDSFVT